MDDRMIKDLACEMEQDGVTTKDMQGVLEGMETRIKSGEDNPTLLDNYYDLKEIERELDWMEGTARQHEAEERLVPTKPITVLFVYDDNRSGVAREQRVDVITETARTVIELDLHRQGFEKVIAVPSAEATSGLAWIWFKPSSERYVLVTDKNKEINAILAALIGGQDYRNNNKKGDE